ncbi:MAG: hypothetical protein J6I56_05105 [Lachnospiraceae bacterium]|nr:hypothetical protein [Lachnospiraceae bacterium]
MPTPIDFGKEFLDSYFHKQDAEKSHGFLADDVVWVTSKNLYHMLSPEEVGTFLDTQLSAHKGPCHVDIISIKSPPGAQETVNIVYELNLVPVDAKTGVYLRVAIAVRKRRNRQEINFISVSHRYENINEVRQENKDLSGENAALAGRIENLEEELKKSNEEREAEKASMEKAFEEEKADMEEALEQQARLQLMQMEADQTIRIDHAKAEARHLAGELEEARESAKRALEETRLRAQEEIEAIRKKAQEDLDALEKKQQDRLLLDRAQIRNELDAEQRAQIAAIRSEYEEKERLLERQILLASERESALKDETGALREQALKTQEEHEAAISGKDQEIQSLMEQGETYRARIEAAEKTADTQRLEIESLEKELQKAKDSAEAVRQQQRQKDEILQRSYDDKQQITWELNKAVERLKHTMKHAELTQTSSEKAAMRDMLSMIGALAAEMKPHEKTFSLAECLNVVELYAGEDARSKGAKLLPFERDERLPGNVTGDKARLQMILLNLIAFVADGAGTVHVRAEADRPVRGKVYLHFHIKDEKGSALGLVGPRREELAYTSAMLGMMGGSMQVRRGTAADDVWAVVTMNLALAADTTEA